MSRAPSRRLAALVVASLWTLVAAAPAEANVAKFRVTEGKILPGGNKAEVTINWEYESRGTYYKGTGVRFYLHEKLPDYHNGNNGTPVPGTIDMKNGRGTAKLIVDLPKGAQEGTNLVLTGYWPNPGHKWGTDSSRPGGQFTLKSGILNVNTATLDQLKGLPGIGGGLAGRIVTFRDQQGGQIKAIADLAQVKGISPKKLAGIQPLLTTTTPKVKAPLVHSVNVNTATVAQLSAIPGIGKSKAQAIVDYRTQHSWTFSNKHQLTYIAGIGRSLASRIEPHIKFEGKTKLAKQNSAFGRYRRAPRGSFGLGRRPLLRRGLLPRRLRSSFRR